MDLLKEYRVPVIISRTWEKRNWVGHVLIVIENPCADLQLSFSSQPESERDEFDVPTIRHGEKQLCFSFPTRFQNVWLQHSGVGEVVGTTLLRVFVAEASTDVILRV